MVSTYFLSSAMPFSAFSILFLFSKAKGLVTIPTVRMPSSLAICAITGAAPVPVPPPIPAVINTRSAPFKTSVIEVLLSSADFLPTSGIPPAPFPPVNLSPICKRFGAFEIKSACLSVLIATNSAEETLASIILLTALFPPPPTPSTLIFTTDVELKSCSSINNITPF